MNDREALRRIAEGKVGHQSYCAYESCEHAEDWARRYLAGKDPDAPRVIKTNGMRIELTK